MTESLSAGTVVQEFKQDFINAYERFEGFLKD